MKQMTDAQVLSRVKGLARRERAATLHLLLYLNEVERRELYAPMGYSTMFAVVTRHLRYSDSGAARRLRVARCFRDYPELIGMFRRCEVNVSTVLAVTGALNAANRSVLISAIRGKSRREVDVLVATEMPVASWVKDSIRPVVVRARPTAPHSRCQSDSGAQADLLTPPPAPSAEPVEEIRVIRFAASPKFEKKLQQVRVLLSARYPSGTSLEQAIDAALELFLDKHDPARRAKRRERRATQNMQARRAIPTVKPVRQPTTRHIPAGVRDEVSTRDGGRCTFVSADGIRCGSCHNIQVDHIRPFALGGSSHPSNLRLLCAKHNRWLAEGTFGKSVGNPVEGDGPDRSP